MKTEAAPGKNFSEVRQKMKRENFVKDIRERMRWVIFYNPLARNGSVRIIKGKEVAIVGGGEGVREEEESKEVRSSMRAENIIGRNAVNLRQMALEDIFVFIIKLTTQKQQTIN